MLVGTHVTGTIGALANSYGFSGAAPAATLGHYRIFGCTGETTDDLVLAAVQRAVLVDKVDIISLSLGTSVGWLDNTPIQIYQDYLATVGVHIVAAAGNERTEGLFYSEQPAAGLLTNAVGGTYATPVLFFGGRNNPTDSVLPVHSDPKTLPAYHALLTGGGSGLIPYSSPAPLVFPAASRIYFTSTNPNLSGDACSALPASTPNLSDKVVIVRRGGCDFAIKLANVGKAGGFVRSDFSIAFSAEFLLMRHTQILQESCLGLQYPEYPRHSSTKRRHLWPASRRKFALRGRNQGA